VQTFVLDSQELILNNNRKIVQFFGFGGLGLADTTPYIIIDFADKQSVDHRGELRRGFLESLQKNTLKFLGILLLEGFSNRPPEAFC
jgi:hypothetical protein